MNKETLAAIGISALLIGIAILFQVKNSEVTSDIDSNLYDATGLMTGEFAPPVPPDNSNTIFYENKELSFSFRYPKALVSQYVNGPIVSSHTISIFPDPIKNQVFVVTPVGDSPAPDSLNEILALSKSDRYALNMWQIHFTDVRKGESKTDLVNRVLNLPDFKYTNLENSEMAGNNPFVYYGGGLGFVAIKESPSRKRIAVWILGGDSRFGPYDYYMIDNFNVFDMPDDLKEEPKFSH